MTGKILKLSAVTGKLEHENNASLPRIGKHLRLVEVEGIKFLSEKNLSFSAEVEVPS